MSGSPSPNVVTVSGGQPGTKLIHHGQIPTGMGQMQRRPLLLQVCFFVRKFENQRNSARIMILMVFKEQPLLLEDLLEQEKREQEKQTGNNLCGALPPLSDADFERLRADVLNSSGMNGPMQPLLSPQSMFFFCFFLKYNK